MADHSPKVSCIISCFNYAEYVGTAIESVLSQDYACKEVIVVDDGSSDGSWKVIQRYTPSVQAIHIANGGQARACFVGVGASTGDFIHFLDADDFLRPGALRAIAAHCRADVAKVQFPLTPVDARGESLGDPFPSLKETYTAGDLVRTINATGSYSTPPTSGNVYRRDVLGYIDSIDYERAVDGILYLLAPFLGRVVTLHEPLVSYRVHDRNDSAFATISPDRFNEEARRFMERLKHLSVLCQKFGLPGWSMRDPAHFGFVQECRLLAQAASGARPPSSDIVRFMGTVWRESQSLRTSMLLSAWAASMLLAPRRLLPAIAAVKADPWSRGAGLKLLKRLAA
jgi:glycosyltransferase involved in cell wall biosynthesis